MTAVGVLFCIIGETTRASPATVQTMSSKRRYSAGISDEELAKMGRRARAVLLARLRYPKDEAHLPGIVQRLMEFGDLSVPDQEISSALQHFFETQAARSATQKPETIDALCLSLWAIGIRGGDQSVDFLVKWSFDDAALSKINITAPLLEDVTSNRSKLIHCAIVALGYTGNGRAAGALARFRREDGRAGQFPFVIDEALRINQSVRRLGIKRYIEGSRATP